MKLLLLLVTAAVLLGGCVVAAPYPDYSAYGYGPAYTTTQVYTYTTPAPTYYYYSPGYYPRQGYYRYTWRQAP